MKDPSFFVGPSDDPRRYQLWRQVGGGAEGRIWQATAALSDGGHVDVAVKVLDPDRFGGVEPPEQIAARWHDQALLLRNLTLGDGVVSVQEAFVGPGLHQGTPEPDAPPATCFVMRWVDGQNLTTWASTQPPGIERLVVLEAAADGLDRLHDAGAVHADIKPANVLVVSREIPGGRHLDTAVLVDFGLMRTITGEPPTLVAGTPGYWAPELRDGSGRGAYSPASDLYSFAALVTFLLTGQAPSATSDPQISARELLTAANIGPEPRDLIVAALHPRPDKRPTDGVSTWLSSVRSGLSSSMMPTHHDQAMAALPLALADSPPAPSPAPRPAPSRRWVAPAAMAVLAAVLGAFIASNLGERSGDDGRDDGTAEFAIEAESSTTASTSTTEAPTTTTSTSAPPTTTEAPPPEEPPPPAVTYVDQNHLVEVYSADIEPVRVNGRDYANALVLATCCDQTPRSNQLDAGRRYIRFKAEVGIPDDERSQYRYRVEVRLDGTAVDTFDVGFGETHPIDYDVSGVLRVELVMSPLYEEGLGSFHNRTLAFADARFEGQRPTQVGRGS